MNDDTRLPPLELVALYEHWKADAKREFANKRDEISSSFFSAIRGQSHSHISVLSQAAQECVLAMLGKARELTIAREYYPSALASALGLFADLAIDVRGIAIGASGRNPLPSNGAIADKCADEGRARLQAEVARWSDEDAMRALAQKHAAIDATPIETKSRAPSFKGGRPPSNEAILDKADEMKARGMIGRDIAKNMRHEPGFEDVQNVEIRGLIDGRYKGAGRPKKRAHNGAS